MHSHFVVRQRGLFVCDNHLGDLSYLATLPTAPLSRMKYKRLTDSAPSASCAQVMRYRRVPDASRAVSCPGRTTRVPPSSSGISVLAPSAAAASASAWSSVTTFDSASI